MIHYKATGVCAKKISFEVKDGVITKIEFDGGCPGNLLGIQAMAVGKGLEEIIDKLRGIRCGGKSTSCPDQLAAALENYMGSDAQSA